MINIKILSYVKAFWDVVPFRHLSENLKRKIILKRQRKIIEYARIHTKYYKNKIPKDWKSITDIPPTDKNDFMAHFNETVTDNRITYDTVIQQLQKEPPSGTIFKKYFIATTSGSSGTPLLTIQDQSANHHDTMLSLYRNNGLKYFPAAYIISPHAFSITSESLRKNHSESNIAKKLSLLISSLDPPIKQIEAIIEQRSKSVFGYTSSLSSLADTAIENNITIPHPKKIFVTGEPLDATEREKITKAFPNARVVNLYACTEGGAMAYECEYGHMHINTDCVLVEPVDKDGNVLPYGAQSEQTLVTNYFNFVQPIIRFCIGDRITLHHGCECGLKEDWVEVDGRTNDFLTFTDKNGKTVKCPPMNILLCVGSVSVCGNVAFRGYQVVLHPKNRLEIRLDCYDTSKREFYFEKVKENLNEYLLSISVTDFEVFLSKDLPLVTTATGKKQKIYVVND